MSKMSALQSFNDYYKVAIHKSAGICCPGGGHQMKICFSRLLQSRNVTWSRGDQVRVRVRKIYKKMIKW